MRDNPIMVKINAPKEDLYLFFNTKKPWWKTKSHWVIRKGHFMIFDFGPEVACHPPFSMWFLGKEGSKTHIPALEVAETVWEEDGKCYFLNNEFQKGENNGIRYMEKCI